MRKACYECCIKHLSQALVISSETVQGYPQHAMDIIGHLGEAADEIVGFHPEVAAQIRQMRISYMADFSYDIEPECRKLFQQLLLLRLQASDKEGETDV